MVNVILVSSGNSWISSKIWKTHKYRTYLIVLTSKPSKLVKITKSGPTMGNPVEDNAPPFPIADNPISPNQ